MRGRRGRGAVRRGLEREGCGMGGRDVGERVRGGGGWVVTSVGEQEMVPGFDTLHAQLFTSIGYDPAGRK
eukprot:469967-Rhodomonas_salina.1